MLPVRRAGMSSSATSSLTRCEPVSPLRLRFAGTQPVSCYASTSPARTPPPDSPVDLKLHAALCAACGLALVSPRRADKHGRAQVAPTSRQHNARASRARPVTDLSREAAGVLAGDLSERPRRPAPERGARRRRSVAPTELALSPKRIPAADPAVDTKNGRTMLSRLDPTNARARFKCNMVHARRMLICYRVPAMEGS